MAKKKRYKLKEKVWVWGHDSNAPWHFVSVPKKETKEILENFGGLSKGWRSLPVLVKIGNTEWKTSIFLDSRTSTYLLPLKAKVRKSEKILDGDMVNYILTITI